LPELREVERILPSASLPAMSARDRQRRLALATERVVRDLLHAFVDHEVRFQARFEDVVVPVLGREDLLVNKRAAGRLQDLADVERLERRAKPDER
jgi:hypothetical protein